VLTLMCSERHSSIDHVLIDFGSYGTQKGAWSMR
jgi:hypothetical protein